MMPSITIYYNEESDVAYFKLSNNPIAYSKIIDDQRWADFDTQGQPVGLQLFNASEKMPQLKRKNIERELVLDAGEEVGR
mgnify:CR=1 FL=1